MWKKLRQSAREDLTHELKQLDIVYYFGNVTVEALVDMIFEFNFLFMYAESLEVFACS